MTSWISRFLTYYRRNGARATLVRLFESMWRVVFGTRIVLFYCDLSKMRMQSEALPGCLDLEVRNSEAQLSPHDRATILNAVDPRRAQRLMAERFQKGASLWVIKNGAEMVGYGWTVTGRTLEPRFFPLTPYDVYLFDFLIFPQYRGKGMNPLLVRHVLCNLAAQCQGRAFLEVAEWNRPQFSSLRRTPFRRMGSAKKVTLGRRTIVYWTEETTASLEQPRSSERHSYAHSDQRTPL